MKYLALLFALAETPVPSQTADWAFMEAQETFVMESVGVRAALRSLPSESRSLLESMGASGEYSYRHRDWASRSMREEVRDVRACFVGQYLGDLEVKVRCRNVLRELSRCEMCGGKGVSYHSWGEAQCGICRGVGHFWPPEDF